MVSRIDHCSVMVLVYSIHQVVTMDRVSGKGSSFYNVYFLVQKKISVFLLKQSLGAFPVLAWILDRPSSSFKKQLSGIPHGGYLHGSSFHLDIILAVLSVQADVRDIHRGPDILGDLRAKMISPFPLIDQLIIMSVREEHNVRLDTNYETLFFPLITADLT